VFLAFAAATPEVNSRVAADCRRKGILVNVADDPESSDFFLPSHLRRGLLVVAVSTSGASPALARRIRERLEPLFPPAYGFWTERLALARRRVLASFPREEDRRRILERLAEKVAALAYANRFPLRPEQ
jgi:precorrin-2 dehydrogenase/sirohydrochlorin ferrochelatase